MHRNKESIWVDSIRKLRAPLQLNLLLILIAGTIAHHISFVIYSGDFNAKSEHVLNPYRTHTFFLLASLRHYASLMTV